MAPKNLLGLLLLIAAFSPGYVYLRVAERRHTRPARSSFLEAVELASIGALISTVVALLVLAAASPLDALDSERLLSEPGAYLAAEPIRCLGALLIGSVGAYLIAAGTARLANKPKGYRLRDPEQVVPGRTVWQHMFRDRKAAQAAPVVANVELRDGRVLTGFLYSWTAHDAEHRELALTRGSNSPMLMRAHVAAPADEILDEFVVLREDDIVAVYGTVAAGS